MPTRHGTFFVQSSHGTVGNFEVVVPRAAGGGAVHYWRDNDAPGQPWVANGLVFGSPDDISDLSLIQSELGTAGNLELVAVEGSQPVHHWRDDGGSGRWQARTPLPGGIAVGPSVAFIQSSHGVNGNYEVVAVAQVGGLAHWFRDNDAPGLPWNSPTLFGSGHVDAIAMIQGTYGTAGNVEIVARMGQQLVHYWRDDGGTWNWTGPQPIPGVTGVSGKHAFLQATLGNTNFEVVAPLAAGGLGHWWRDNADPLLPWHGPTMFGTGNVSDVALIQNRQSSNLELVGRVGQQLVHYWRDATTEQWMGPEVIADETAPDPATAGASTIAFTPPIVAIHAALVHTSKLAIWGYTDFDATIGLEATVDLGSGAATVPAEHHHLFCSGHAFLPDGRIVAMGGHVEGVKGVHVFDPNDGAWEHMPEMEQGRWYPTCTALPNGQVLTISGTMGGGGPVSPTSPVNNTLQVFGANTGIQPSKPLPSPFSDFFPPDFPTIDLYPFVFVLPSGELLVHSRNTTRFYNWTNDTWTPLQLQAVYQFTRTYPGQGSAVLLPLRPTDNPPYRVRMLITGGGGADPQDLSVATPATATTELLDLGEATPAWRNSGSMAFARVMHDATLLPDGTVLVLGGSATGRADMGIDPVLGVELFDPTTETWTTLAPMKTPRSYHSTALLLPDGRVLSGGKDYPFNLPPLDYPEHRLEAYSPPYLFRGGRPQVTAAPASIGYGAGFVVQSPQAANVNSVVLMRPGCVTHSFNMEQRLVELVIVGQTGNQLSLQAPPNANIAPPGYYMLFLLNTQGVPSVATFVALG